jgi:hypothetical protein
VLGLAGLRTRLRRRAGFPTQKGESSGGFGRRSRCRGGDEPAVRGGVAEPDASGSFVGPH